MAVTQPCPICSTTLRAFPRYPRYLCSDCAEQARSAEGRPLAFSNVDASGGYRAEYADTHEPYDSHRCFVNGVECHADEHRFGGIVLQTIAGPETAGSNRTSPRMLQPLRTAPTNAALADRARGVLIGLALGDALGAPVEFQRPGSIAGRRKELFELPGGGSFDWAPGEFTDDTQMALVLARHLQAHGGALDADTLAAEFADWAEDAADVGNQTRKVLDAVRGGASWRHATAQLSPTAAGNGSLMRVAPVALVAASEQAAAVLARHQSVVTHPNDSCIDACSGFARLLWRTVETGELRFDALHDYFTVAEVRQAADTSLQDAAPTMSGWVLHTLCGALWAVRGADCFADAVWRAVALGIDADTVGAVAGALAGARWGMGGIPRELSARLQSLHPLFQDHYPQALIDLADGLVAGRRDTMSIDR